MILDDTFFIPVLNSRLDFPSTSRPDSNGNYKSTIQHSQPLQLYSTLLSQVATFIVSIAK